MKRLLLLLPLLLTPTAQAVDYVRCEAMNKAAGRARSSANAVLEMAYYKAEIKGESSAKARSRAEADPGYKEAMQRLERIQADYKAEGCY